MKREGGRERGRGGRLGSKGWMKVGRKGREGAKGGGMGVRGKEGGR